MNHQTKIKDWQECREIEGTSDFFEKEMNEGDNNMKVSRQVIMQGLKQTFCIPLNTAGMKRPEFAQWLGIPYRTYQDWELGNSQVPEYVLRLMAYKVRTEILLKAGKLKYVDDVCDDRQEE